MSLVCREENESVPELPEVETIVRDLRPLLRNQSVVDAQIGNQPLRKQWREEWTQELPGQTILEATRRGKWVVIPLAGGQRLVFHMGMTGQLRVIPHDEPIESHTHLVLGLGDGSKQLRFRDIRRFGSATLYQSEDDLQQFFDESELGPEPFGLTPDYWRPRLAATSRNLKAILLDQRIVAGVGNIYADEILFEAKLHPTRLGKETSRPQVKRLCAAVDIVLNRAIEKRGSTIRNYVGGSGLAGGFQEEFCVYGRTGNPCVRCQAKITHMRLAGRSTHFCPRCQKRKRASTSDKAER